MICDNVFTIARGKCELDYSHRPDGSISVTLTIARAWHSANFETITIVAEDPSDLEPLFGYLPEKEN